MQEALMLSNLSRRLSWKRQVCPLLVAIAGLLCLSACADKAKSDYTRCVQLDVQGDVGGAWDACNSAVAADPTSKSGRAAAAKLAEMKQRYDDWKRDEASRKKGEDRKVAAQAIANSPQGQAE
jgi:hypothetical protein